MRPTGKDSDAVLLQRTAGDPEAFAVFYDRWEGPILAYFQRRVREPEVAVDLTGEVFAAVLGAAAQFRGEHGDGSAAAWLFTIARNTLSTSLRRGRVEEEARRRLAAWEPVALVDVDLDAIAALGEDGPALARALHELPPRQREAVRARVLEELTYPEIAARLDCSELVVRKNVSRGLKSLRKNLEQLT
jgi:RNA polymerase sigma factor (sigma-70 family)